MNDVEAIIEFYASEKCKQKKECSELHDWWNLTLCAEKKAAEKYFTDLYVTPKQKF